MTILGIEFGDQERELYEALPTVEDADTRRIALKSFDAVLHDYANLADKHDMTGKGVGVLLLHRHWMPEGNQQMIEVYEPSRGGSPALITAPRAFNNEVWPSRWALQRDGMFHAIEFSKDPAVGRDAKALSANGNFLREYAAMLALHHVQHLFGLCTTRRDTLSLSPGHGYVEDSDPSGHESVVRSARVGAPGVAQYLKTAWVSQPTMVCKSEMVCNGFCQTIGNKPHESRHDKGRTHVPEF
jgi:hypothetical protein